MPIPGNVRKPGVLPWRERKSTRGKPKTICSAGYVCACPDCDYFNTDSTFHALVGDGKRGADDIQWLRCQACGKRFSGRRGTALYHLRTPAAQVAQVFLVVNLGPTITDTTLLFHHSEATIRLRIARAGEHAEQVHAHFFRHLTLGHLQSVSGLPISLRANSIGKWHLTCCTAKSRNPIAADSLGSSAVCAWATSLA